MSKVNGSWMAAYFVESILTLATACLYYSPADGVPLGIKQHFFALNPEVSPSRKQKAVDASQTGLNGFILCCLLSKLTSDGLMTLRTWKTSWINGFGPTEIPSQIHFTTELKVDTTRRRRRSDR
jgi:hypothetical protein